MLLLPRSAVKRRLRGMFANVRTSMAEERHLVEGIIGAANWSEVLQKARQHGAQPGLVARLLPSFGLQVVDVTAEDAQRAADLWVAGSAFSLADRLCLALGVRLALAVVTTDGAWQSIAHGPRVIVTPLTSPAGASELPPRL